MISNNNEYVIGVDLAIPNSDSICFSVPIGLQRNGDFIPEEVALKAWKDMIGKNIPYGDFDDYIVTKVDSQNGYIWVDCKKR